MNSVHITTQTTAYYSVAVGDLPGDTNHDYHEHISQSVANMASVYSSFHWEDERCARS